MTSMIRCAGLLAALVSCAGVAAEQRLAQSLIIPEPAAIATPRRVTVDDMASLRRIDTLRLSPDRRRFAMLVRQADASTNSYRMGWFVGSTQDGRLTPVGDGGEARLAVGRNQTYNGFEYPAVRWSADGRWIAYTLARGGEVQLWRSRTDGGKQEQVTHNGADVREFEWSDDGKVLYFTVGTAREELRAQETARQLNGYHYDTDFRLFTDLMAMRPPLRGEPSVWVVPINGGRERLANDSERREFDRARDLSGDALRTSSRSGAFAARGDGMLARARLDANDLFLSHLEVSQPSSSADPIRCAAPECSGQIQRVWWGGENLVFFLKPSGSPIGASLYTWNIDSGTVSLVASVEDSFLSNCDLGAEMRMVCVRETAELPPHLAFVDPGAGGIRVLVDVNPEFRNIALGKVERFEWETPKFPWNQPGAPLDGVFPGRAQGYILYPPDFDAARKYPVFIHHYVAMGFDNTGNREYALHAMAASGFIVLNLSFPQESQEGLARLGAGALKLLYSEDLGFPHPAMYLESLLRALDTVVARGFVNEQRVGIGGVSEGATMALYLIQKRDRIAAVSIGTGTMSQLEYYAFTLRGEKQGGRLLGAVPRPTGPGVEFWKQLDLADQVEAIEAPILINTPAQEIYTLVRLMKHMNEAGKPYDAYVFANAPHIKVQPAQLLTCMQRNLDWFRFWLQSHEDPDPAKAEQYARWRKLRELNQRRAPIGH